MSVRDRSDETARCWTVNKRDMRRSLRPNDRARRSSWADALGSRATASRARHAPLYARATRESTSRRRGPGAVNHFTVDLIVDIDAVHEISGSCIAAVGFGEIPRD